MKSEKNILVAFLLNLVFSVVEAVGGIITGSVAILADAFHDMGDAASIGVSYFFEKKSKKAPDARYTYGYARYSVLGGLVMSLVLLLGSVAVICKSVLKLFDPTEIDYDRMIVFALLGICVNLCAAIATHKGRSLNQRAVRLHMLEDILGWIVVLIGAVAMRFTDLVIFDPVMSIAVALFILIGAFRGIGEAMRVFLERAPNGMDSEAVQHSVLEVEGVCEAHHIHVWTLDGTHAYATAHVVIKKEADTEAVKANIRRALGSMGVICVTLELEYEGEKCCERVCDTRKLTLEGQHSHSHHHHHAHHE